MHVALLSDRFPPDPGGLARASERIARGLVAAGQRVEVFTISRESPASSPATPAETGLRVHRLAPQRREDDTTAELFDRLVAAHRAEPFDALHGLYLVRAGFVAAYAGRYLGVPSVASARGNDLDRSLFDPARQSAILRALDLATIVTAVSTDLARKARALAPRARVEFVPNGVDAAAFRPVPRDPALVRSLALEGREVVGFSGELRRKKGLVPLLRALGELCEARPVTLLAVGGVRADDEGLVTLLRKQHPRLQVSLLPYRDPSALPALYALMDVFVHPSLRDGLPNALLEAMACGRPVIGSAAGGIPDVVRDGTDGLLVEPGDAAALARAIAALLDDRGRAATLAAAARERVSATFTPAAETGAYLCLYDEARRTGAGGRV